MSRPIRALLYPERIHHNLAVMRRRVPQAEVMAVVKANAYGHGIQRIFSALKSADSLALLDMDDARLLRELGWSKPILLLEGAFRQADWAMAAALSLDMVIHAREQFERLNDAFSRGVNLSKSRLFLKCNTGMNRLGLAEHEFVQLVSTVLDWRSKGAIADVVFMSHYANADQLRHEQLSVEVQYERLMACRAQLATDLPAEAWSSIRISAGNSAAILNHGQRAGDIVRPGIATYGAAPGPWSAEHEGLKPVMTLRSELIAVQHVPMGGYVGYGSRWQAQRDSRIGVVACGYADGYPRHAPDGTPVLVAGQRCALAGRVSMDLLTVDLSDHPDASVGSEVVLWGDGLSVDDVAQSAGTIGYELLAGVTARVPFCVLSEPGR